MLVALAQLCSTADAGTIEGRALFEHEWSANDPLSPSGDGLGPLYNATSCAACHSLGGTGGAGDNSDNVLLLPSGVVHNYGTSKRWTQHREEMLHPKHVPEFGCGTAAMHFFSQFTQSFRQTPALFGASALDRITEQDLEVARLAGESAGVSGRIARDAEGRAGKFGWKGQTATIASFVEAACVTEIGLGTPSTPQPADPTEREPAQSGPDLSPQQLTDLVAFVESLPAPLSRSSAEAVGGRSVFHQVGCEACHAERLGTLEGAWTDLLLHDLGPDLADGGLGYAQMARTEDGAEPSEWRTPPLWGLSASAPYLHDGRASTLEDAIGAHSGEATAALQAYSALDKAAKDRLTDFLLSL